MKFKLNEQIELKFKKGDIAVPKPEWLNPGEKAESYIILDSWYDDTLNREKISVISAREAKQMHDRTLIGFPHSRQDSFADYYDKIE